MAVQIIKPVDTEFPMEPLTVEADTATEEEFAWLSLLCCSYGVPMLHISIPIGKKISMCEEDTYSCGLGALGKVRNGVSAVSPSLAPVPHLQGERQ